jgi:hypothetical protein
MHAAHHGTWNMPYAHATTLTLSMFKERGAWGLLPTSRLMLVLSLYDHGCMLLTLLLFLFL